MTIETWLAYVGAVLIVMSILVAGPWMLNLLLTFTRRLYLNIPGLIG